MKKSFLLAAFTTRTISASILTLLASIAFAQSPASLSHREFLDYTHQLYAEGNRCYAETGNKTRLKHIIEDYENALTQRTEAGLLSQQTQDSLWQEVNKLAGDYHYLNSDEDDRSYDLAEDYFMQCLAFAEDPAHRSYQTVNHDRFILYRELGQLYYKEKRYQEAYDMIDAAMVMASNYLSPYDDDVLDILSQWAICKARVARNGADFNEAIEAIDDVVRFYGDTLSGDYGEALRKKAKILMLQQEKGFSSSSASALKCYKGYYRLKKREALSRFASMNADDREHYWMRLRPFVTDCYRLEDSDPGFLFDVTLFSKSLLLEYAKNKRLQLYTWQQVQKRLQPGECAIEFVQYEKYEQRRMGALVLVKQGSPVFISLGKVEDILGIPLRGGGIVEDAISFDDPWLKDDFYTDSLLFNTIWTDELLDAIGENTRKVYFAPDGIFHHMAIEYMIPKGETTLTTDRLHRLTSTRQLLAKAMPKTSGKVLACGNVNFDKAGPTAPSQTGEAIPNDESAYFFLKSFGIQQIGRAHV